MAFDPYHKWLGVVPKEQPASHYKLLGIAEFESDADVIDGSAERQTVYLRTFQTGPDAELAEQLLNEVAAARVCLLDEKARSIYDEQLKEKQTAAEPSPTPRLPEISVATDRLTRPKTIVQWPTPWTQSHWFAAVGGALVTLLVVIVAWVLGPDDISPKAISNTQSQQQLDAAKKVGSPPRAAKSLPVSLQQGLVAYYPFNGNAKDESGNGKDGRMNNVITKSDRYGREGQALGFRGDISSFVEVRYPGIRLDNLTVSMWVKCSTNYVRPDQAVSFWGIPTKDGKGTGVGMSIRIGDGDGTLAATTRTTENGPNRFVSINGQQSRRDTGWFHCVLTLTNETIRLHEDGRLVASATHPPSAPIDTHETVQFGRGLASVVTSSRLEFVQACLLDDIRIYNRALSAAEVKALYEFEKL